MSGLLVRDGQWRLGVPLVPGEPALPCVPVARGRVVPEAPVPPEDDDDARAARARPSSRQGRRGRSPRRWDSGPRRRAASTQTWHQSSVPSAPRDDVARDVGLSAATRCRTPRWLTTSMSPTSGAGPERAELREAVGGVNPPRPRCASSQPTMRGAKMPAASLRPATDTPLAPEQDERVGPVPSAEAPRAATCARRACRAAYRSPRRMKLARRAGANRRPDAPHQVGGRVGASASPPPPPKGAGSRAGSWAGRAPSHASQRPETRERLVAASVRPARGSRQRSTTTACHSGLRRRRRRSIRRRVRFTSPTRSCADHVRACDFARRPCSPRAPRCGCRCRSCGRGCPRWVRPPADRQQPELLRVGVARVHDGRPLRTRRVGEERGRDAGRERGVRRRSGPRSRHSCESRLREVLRLLVLDKVDPECRTRAR